MNYDKILSNIFLLDNWHFNKLNVSKYKTARRLKNKYQNIVQYIENRYNDSESFKETIYRMFNNIEIRPVCKTCGNKVDFIGKGNVIFRKYCSNSCSAISEETKQRKQESDKLKHGGKLGWNICTEQKIQNRKKTFIERYGSTSYNNSEKRKQTCLDKYGVSNIMFVKEFKEKRNNTLRERFNETNLLLIPESQEKRNKTIKELRKTIKSKEEDKAFEILSSQFSDIIRQYSSDKYPWLCDFYIVNEDLYIECHFSHFHYSKPFEGTENDYNEIKKLKYKSEQIKKIRNVKKTQYDMIIYTWSDLDVRKRNTAQSNNLNYKEFYSLDELKKWINKESHT